MWAVWIALLLWAAPTQGVTTNCAIPAVERFQNTSLTCTFSGDIRKLKQDFKVQFYKSNTTDSTEVILDCYWVNEKLECTVHKCCEYDYHVNETLTLRVLNVTETRVGRYVCFVLPAAPESYSFCNFTLTEKHHTVTSESNLAALAALVVIPVIICIILIIIVWRRKRGQKAGGKTKGRKPCHFWPGQWCSAKKKPDDEESKQPMNKSKDEANDGSQSRHRSIDEDLHSTNPKAVEKFGQKSDDVDRSQRPVHTRVIERIRTCFVRLLGREHVNQNVELSSTQQQEPLLMKSDPLNTSMTGPETKPEEIQKDQIGVSSSGTIAPVAQSQKMQSPSGQNDVITPIADQSSDDGTRTTIKTSETLGINELQTENETKDQKTQESDVYKYTTNIAKEGRKVKSVRKEAKIKEKVVQDKAENEEKIAKDKAEKEIKSARKKAEEEKKSVKENAEKEEKTAKGKAEELEKIAKEKAEREEKMANEKAKEEEKIAKDKAKKEKGIAKRTSKKMSNTSVNIEEKVKKISNEKDDQMTKIAKRKDEQMEIIAKEKEKQLEKIEKEKREELEKIANAREKRLEEISKRETEEIEQIKKKKEEEIEEIRNVKWERMQTITNKKEKKMETIYKKKEEKTNKKGKVDKQTAVKESHKGLGSNEQSKEKESEDDACDVKLANQTDSLLPTKMSNAHVNPATESQNTTDTIIQVNELASHHDTPTQDQTSQGLDKGGNPVKQKNNEDIESNGKATKKSSCAVS